MGHAVAVRVVLLCLFISMPALTSIEQAIADIISNSSPAMQLAQVGAKIKESLDSIVESLAEPVVWNNTVTGSSGKQVYYNNKLWVANASVTGADVPGVSAKWDPAGAGGGGGGGGGGSAYPDSFLIESSAGTRSLTDADQGFVAASIAGVTFALPTTAADGTIFKFISTAAPFDIDAGSKFIINFVSSTCKVQPGMRFDIVAVNIYIGLGVDLYWYVINSSTLDASPWDSTTKYIAGQMVSAGGQKYLSIESTSNNNQNPETSSSYWFKMPNTAPEEAVGGSISDTDISFSATAPPSSFVGANYAYKSAYSIKMLTVSAEFSGAGTDVTQVVIDLDNTFDANPSLSMNPGANTFGTAFIGALDLPCRFVAASNAIVITVPAGVTGVTGQLIHAKLVY